MTAGGHHVNSSFRIAILANTLALTAGSLYGKSNRALGTEQTLAIRLYDQAQVPHRMIHLATEEAARVLRAAGIRISWEQPPAEAPEDRGIDMRSADVRQPDERPYLVVRLTRATPAGIVPGALGFALPFARTGAHASIFFDRVEALTVARSTATYVILGHTIAHEIGHVLLRSSEHSTGGLMQAHWNAATWRLASAGLLAFRYEEAERMGAELRRFQARHSFRQRELITASGPSISSTGRQPPISRP
jgi:hypothetical protein